jgi:hypothetical protein
MSLIRFFLYLGPFREESTQEFFSDFNGNDIFWGGSTGLGCKRGDPRIGSRGGDGVCSRSGIRKILVVETTIKTAPSLSYEKRK